MTNRTKDWEQRIWERDVADYYRMENLLKTTVSNTLKQLATKRMQAIREKYPNVKF